MNKSNSIVFIASLFLTSVNSLVKCKDTTALMWSLCFCQKSKIMGVMSLFARFADTHTHHDVSV